MNLDQNDFHPTTSNTVSETIMTASSKTASQNLYNSLKWPIICYGILASGYIASLPGKYIWFSWHPAMMMMGFIVLAGS